MSVRSGVAAPLDGAATTEPPPPTRALSVEQFRALVVEAVAPRPARPARLDEAHGRVLADDLVSRWPLPLFDNSAMDGFAVRRDDVLDPPVSLRVVGDVPAGSAANPHLGPGEAARIMTGARVPDDADAIVPHEQTDASGAVGPEFATSVTVFVTPRESGHIRFAGEDVPAHGMVLTAGTVLGARQLSAAAAAGHSELRVVPRPRVSVIVTGDELVDAGCAPGRGEIPDSNSVLLRGSIIEAGAEPASTERVDDDEQAVLAALDRADGDVIVFCGGASVGAYDAVRGALGSAGLVDFRAVAMRPGGTQGFGLLPSGVAVFCLPGNPVSAFVSFEAFVRPALRRLAGHPHTGRPRRLTTAAASWPSPSGRTQFMPVRFVGEGIVPAAHRSVGSHRVGALGQVDALAIVSGTGDVAIGDEIEIWDLRV